MTEGGIRPHAQSLLANLTILFIPFVWPAVWEGEFLSRAVNTFES